jgi:hypothetical protein
LSSRPDQEDLPNCHHCGEVIGVYEPMVVVTRGVPLRTSRAALRDDARTADDPCFHSECFARRGID